MELVDAHCHLYLEPLARDRAGALARARSAGVTQVVVPAYDLASWNAVDELAGLPGVRVMLGLHPWAAHEPMGAAALARGLRDMRAVGIGEIGLDAKVDVPGLAIQRDVLGRQLDLAAELDLPVALHCRGAFEELLELLDRYRPRLRGFLHAFSRGPDLARRFTELGLLVSFGGAITRPRAERARRSAQALPLDRILLETDAPSIGLEGVDPEAVEPRHVRDVAAALAVLRGVTLEEIAEATTDNARRLFGIA